MCIKFGLKWLGRTSGARACSEKETAREQRDVALERKGRVRGVQNERVAEEMAMAGSSMVTRTTAERVRPNELPGDSLTSYSLVATCQVQAGMVGGTKNGGHWFPPGLSFLQDSARLSFNLHADRSVSVSHDFCTMFCVPHFTPPHKIVYYTTYGI